MRGAAPLVLVLLLLLAPCASAAWTARLAQEVSPGLDVGDALLLAGRVRAASTGGAPFALLVVDHVDLGGPATVRVCPDRAGEPDPDCAPTPAAVVPAATVRVRGGGLVVQPLQPGGTTLDAGPGPALLGGAAVVLNRVAVGPGLYASGPATLEARGEGFLLRPLGPDAQVEVVSPQGVRAVHGAGHTLRVTDAAGLRLTGARGVLGLSEGDPVQLSRAGVGEADRTLRTDALLDLQREALPPGHAQRRADLAAAFGPFEAVPALLDGAIAAHQNLTLDGAPQDGFRLLRSDRATLRLQEGRWTGEAEAAYLVEGDVLAAHPGARVDPPILVPILLALLALAGRLASPREAAAPARRRAAWLLRLAGLLGLALLADLLLAGLLGVHPLLGEDGLTPRSRVQLALVALGTALAAYGMLGLAVQSLARTAFATRGRPDAAVLPALAGLAATALFLLLAHAPLLSLVARWVRL